MRLKDPRRFFILIYNIFVDSVQTVKLSMIIRNIFSNVNLKSLKYFFLSYFTKQMN